ncbi:MAG: helix-turn-helix transcriptional regulator [Rhodothermales bacterium]|nr:helix-turn-helix transcriptional regulator [Rhodothermales bacterium]
MSSRQLKAASSKPLVLSLLRFRESYGYQIIKDVERLSGGSLEWTEAMLYPVLHRMEKEGLIRSRWDVSEEGRRRKYYSISEAGRASLQEEKQAWMDVHSVLTALWSGSPDLTVG